MTYVICLLYLQLVRDNQLLGMDYYVIACSNNILGEGWCQEFTSRDEISEYLSAKAHLQRLFPIYCQSQSSIEEIRATIAAANPNIPKKVTNNQSDVDKKVLGGKLNNMLSTLDKGCFLYYQHSTYKS